MSDFDNYDLGEAYGKNDWQQSLTFSISGFCLLPADPYRQSMHGLIYSLGTAEIVTWDVLDIEALNETNDGDRINNFFFVTTFI